MNAKLQQTIAEWGWKPGQRRLLLAVSGGLDSMVMAHAFFDLGFDIGIAHVHYGLRGAESQGDADFVAAWAHARQLPFYLLTPEQLDWSGSGSLQQKARKLRYNWFDHLQNQYGYTAICTAHHLNDALETTLYHLARGTGLEGLVGFRSSSGIYRPLIGYSRAELQQWAEAQHWLWRHDSSNDKDSYTRNRIRQQWIPLLREINPSLEASYAQSRLQWEHTLAWAQHSAQREWRILTQTQQDGLRIDREALLELPGWPQLLYWGLQAYGFAQWDEVQRLPFLEHGKKVVSPTHQIVQQRDGMWVYALKNRPHQTQWTLAPGTVLAEPFDIALADTALHAGPHEQVFTLDASALSEPLVLRLPQPGDYIYPSGMQGQKKLSKLFKDAHWPAPLRPHTWVLASGSEVLWVRGLRMSRKLSEASRGRVTWWLRTRVVNEMEK